MPLLIQPINTSESSPKVGFWPILLKNRVFQQNKPLPVIQTRALGQSDAGVTKGNTP